MKKGSVAAAMEETSLERERARRRERERERRQDILAGREKGGGKGGREGLIYRRGVSVIISPSLSRSRGRELHPVHLHPSGYRDCGLARASLRASVPLAAGHP